jgi:hypothetical protein
MTESGRLGSPPLRRLCAKLSKTGVDAIMRVRGLPRLKAERLAFEAVLIDGWNATHLDTRADRCTHYGERETPDAIQLPIGVGVRLALMPSDCWTPWVVQGRAKAEENLPHLGIVQHHDHRKEPLMSNIELSIPAELTAAQIRRGNPSIDEETAQKLAAELHDIVARIKKGFALQPPDLPIEESDAIQTLLRTAVGIWPKDEDAAANESVWAMEQITRAGQLTGADDLYKSYLRVCDKVDGTDFASLLTPAPPRPSASRR